MVDIAVKRSRLLSKIINSMPPSERLKAQIRLNTSPDADRFEQMLISAFGGRFNA